MPISVISIFFFLFNFYMLLRAFTASQSFHHVSTTFALSYGLPIPSIQKFWLGSFIHLFFDLPSDLLPSGFQFRLYFIIPLKLYTCPSHLIFFFFQVFVWCFILLENDLISYSILLRIRLSDLFLLFSLDIGRVSYAYKISGLTKTLFSCYFDFFDHKLDLKIFCCVK